MQKEEIFIIDQDTSLSILLLVEISIIKITSYVGYLLVLL